MFLALGIISPTMTMMPKNGSGLAEIEIEIPNTMGNGYLIFISEHISAVNTNV